MYWEAAVPTVLKRGKLRFCINANDHNPPHVHVLGPGGREARIAILTGIVMSQSDVRFNRNDMREIVKVVDENRQELLAAWEEYRNG